MKKGFTLIELLAVIVILAIIALIATPIVLSIISDSKESASLRSAEMYLKGVETSVATATLNEKNIANGTYQITKDGDICLVKLTNNKCEGEGNTLKVDVSGEIPVSGSVTVESGEIKYIDFTYSNGKTIIKNTEGNLVYAKELSDICEYQNNGVAEKTAGAKYSCEVKPGTSYDFYVLTTPTEGDTRINLIMDQNINSDGTPAGMTGTIEIGENVYNLVAWNNESGQSTNVYGPVTAMNFLYNATKDWTNIDPVNYIYNDKTTQGTTNADISYTSFVSTNGIATITPLSGDGVTIGTSDYPLRARMPIYASDTTITEVASKTNTSYLYDNLDPDGMKAPYGYWTLSTNASGSNSAWYVGSSGKVNSYNVYVVSISGVRAVITLKI